MSDDSIPDSKRGREENLRKAFSTIERVANRIDLDVTEINLAESTYKQYLEQRDYPIDDIEDTALASLYVAAKFNGSPVIPEDITQEDPVTTSRKELLRRSKDITSDLSLDLEGLHDITPFVDRICEELDVDEAIRRRAKDIITIAEKGNVTGGKKPAAIAAAAIYLASTEYDERIPQSEIAEAANVTTVTIRNRYQEQRDAVRKLEPLPSDPFEIIDWFSERIGVSDQIRERAHAILTCGENNSYPIGDSPEWAAAALRRASKEYDNKIGVKALKAPLAASSHDIKSKIKDLEKALRTSMEYAYYPEDR